MAIKILKEYHLGDMVARYLKADQEESVGFQLIPKEKALLAIEEKNEKIDSLVQLKVVGDIFDEAYSLGCCMRNSETVRALKYQNQTCEELEDKVTIDTVLVSDTCQVIHHLRWKKGTDYVRIFCDVQNISGEDISLEMFESFSMGNLSPFLKGDGHEQMYLHRIRSVWSQEGRHECIPIEDLQLEPAWDPHAVRVEKFGQAGSMPVNKFFPFAAIEDRTNQIFWGAQIAHNASWQIELYRKDDGLAISGGLADRDFGHWMKTVSPKETFTTPEAIVSCANTSSFDIFSGRLTQAALEGVEMAPETEKDLPIIFNEYCTTWGNPSHENIEKIVSCIKEKGFRYFVIDCGWYKEDGIPWDIAMGDYNVSKTLFPKGLEKTVAVIKEAGMIPGIWFEIENVGRAAKAYQNTEHLLHRDGKVLTSYSRRFWDMRDPYVQDYLKEKVIGTLKKYGFGYMKSDYNETIGWGCDGAESLGEGLRKNMAASAEFIELIKKEVPGIVLENCASGGHRLEPSLMAQMSMASFSDAHECPEIPLVAANLHRVIHPVQSQIWAVIRKDDSLKRIAYSVAATFLGRMCISGDVTELSDEQWRIIDDGMDYYRKIVPIIKDGQSYRFGPKVKSARNPKGWQALLRVAKDGKAFVTIHTFDGELPEVIEVTLPDACCDSVSRIYSDTDVSVTIKDGVLTYRPTENWKAVSVLLGD